MKFCLDGYNIIYFRNEMRRQFEIWYAFPNICYLSKEEFEIFYNYYYTRTRFFAFC